MEPIGFEGQTDSFSSSNESQRSLWIFGDLRFRLVFGRNISWTSIKTLVMEPVDLEGQTNSFSSSYEPKWSNGASWSQGENGSIFKFKRALKQVKPDFANFGVL
ncbi:hypothetical protein H5410_035145 [Solanum commersonii]|uniref:Uncharacterized protein n=1 Tax=Solanum commersonii TaxID=4109 RepID=A0A9J5Y0E5_SOLCO|nr:hypothetical protein H5410_035145 [Solanum commersonii]